VQWVPFNEGWGEYDPARIADMVKDWDPSRLVNNNSGSNCCGFDGGNGDVIDDHRYVGPGNTNKPSAKRIAVLGEFGGLGLRVSGHEWQPGKGFGYEMVPTSAALTDRFVSLDWGAQRLQSRNSLSAVIYTQLTDVENEANGLYTYDRQVLKVDSAQVRAANRALIEGTPVRVAAPLPVNKRISLNVTTVPYVDRYLRHSDGLGYTAHVDTTSPALLKQDATWTVRPGLGDARCYSLESVNYPGQYLRHASSRVRMAAKDGTSQFNRDATWCSRPSVTSAGVSLEALDFPGKYLRHYNSELWLAGDGGAQPYETHTSFGPDVTWIIAAPWAP
jgi:hypothetical protein